jgi:eukaryotic-like serine/threonine-protein kinase
VTGGDWARVRRIFEAALDRPPAERPGYVDDACGTDASLRAEVVSLLQAHEAADGFIEAPAYEGAARLLIEEPLLAAGQAVGPYIIRQEIGRGGMGVVYLADDTRLSRRVALKAIPSGRGSDADRRERLRKEARAAAALSHPGIATVYAIEEIGAELYLASEYVPGETLRALIQQGPMPAALTVDIAVQLARALAAAHAQGVVHHDLKPENVVRTTAGVVKILDFGLARAEHVAATGLTENQPGAGTPGYMAPEQIRGEEMDFRGDLFAFGVVVYEMATGTNPFEAKTPTATIARILEDVPEPLSRVGPSGSAALDGIVAACLAKDRRERYGSTRQLVADLERFEADLSAEPREAKWAAGITPRWWWECHQIVVVVVYVATLYPVWQVRHWLNQPWATLLLCSMSAVAAVAATVRLHLWFSSRFYPAELPTQRLRALGWTRASDLALAATLLAAGLAIASEHQATGMLLVAVAIAAAVASFVIEPATARAAFGE